MSATLEMTRPQEHRFYRHAVQASLETFYGKTRPEAARLVREWSRRLTESGAAGSDLFLHAEPINTAAGLADVRAIPITANNRDAYHRILDESRDLVRANASRKKLKKTEPERRGQLVQTAVSSQ